MNDSFLPLFPVFVESVIERDRYMSPMEAQDFGLIDKVLVHPPQAGQDEPELVQKEPSTGAAAAAGPSPMPDCPAPDQVSPGTNPPSSYKPEPWTYMGELSELRKHFFMDWLANCSWVQDHGVFLLLLLQY